MAPVHVQQQWKRETIFPKLEKSVRSCNANDYYLYVAENNEPDFSF